MRKNLPALVVLLLSSTVAAHGAMPLRPNGGTHLPPNDNPANQNNVPVNIPTKSVLLNVPLIPQKTCCWCWAASGQMVMTYTGHPIQQCQQATYQFGAAAGQNCCNSPTPGVCVSGGQVEIGHYGYTYQQLGDNSALSRAQIENDVYGRHMPWIINPHGPGFGHVIVGVGYTTVFGNLTLVAINDPWPPNSGDFYWESYAHYKCGFWSGVCHTEGYDLYAIVPPLFPILHLPPPITRAIDVKPNEALVEAPDPLSAARASLPLFSQTIDADETGRVGIRSGAELLRATLDAPVDEYNIKIANLREWRHDGRASDILAKSPGAMIPVEVNGRVAATFRMMQEGGRWSVATFGGPALGRAWERARANGGQFLVEIDGLELAFAGRRVGDKIRLTPLFDEPNLKIGAGHEEAAEDIFTRIQPLAAIQRPNILINQGR